MSDKIKLGIVFNDSNGGFDVIDVESGRSVQGITSIEYKVGPDTPAHIMLGFYANDDNGSKYIKKMPSKFNWDVNK